jgi:hypothetical protein
MACTCVTRVNGGMAYIRPCREHRSLRGPQRLEWIAERMSRIDADVRLSKDGGLPATALSPAIA